MQTLHKVEAIQSNPVHFRNQNYRSLMLGCQKGKKMAEKLQKNS